MANASLRGRHIVQASKAAGLRERGGTLMAWLLGAASAAGGPGTATAGATSAAGRGRRDDGPRADGASRPPPRRRSRGQQREVVYSAV